MNGKNTAYHVQPQQQQQRENKLQTNQYTSVVPGLDSLVLIDQCQVPEKK